MRCIRYDTNTQVFIKQGNNFNAHSNIVAHIEESNNVAALR